MREDSTHLADALDTLHAYRNVKASEIRLTKLRYVYTLYET